MSSTTYKTEAVVLKKTKLNENDLILTMLNMDGKQIRAVAKGARKPASIFSSRLELGSQVNLLMAHGKTLDIIKEVKLINAFADIRKNVEKFAALSPALEILYKTSMLDLENQNLYLPTIKFLHVLNDSDNSSAWPALSCAHIIKTCVFLGFRPQLVHCVNCNTDMRNVLVDVNLPLSFSYLDGGIVCRNCASKMHADKVSARAALLVHQLMHDKFSDIDQNDYDIDGLMQVITFCKLWINCHVGNHMKSLDFYLKNYK